MSEYKQVEKQLKEYNMKKTKIDIIEKEIELISDECGVTGINYEGTGNSGSNLINSLTEQTALSNVEAVHYLTLDLNRLKYEVERIELAIEELNSEEKDIVTLFYIDDREWQYISNKVNFSKRQCIRKRDKAIHKMTVALIK